MRSQFVRPHDTNLCSMMHHSVQAEAYKRHSTPPFHVYRVWESEAHIYRLMWDFTRFTNLKTTKKHNWLSTLKSPASDKCKRVGWTRCHVGVLKCKCQWTCATCGPYVIRYKAVWFIWRSCLGGTPMRTCCMELPFASHSSSLLLW